MAVKDLFSLGAIYPSDFLKPGEKPRCEPVELNLVMDENGLVKLDRTAPKEVLWGEKYFYRSSISETMRKQLRDVVDSIKNVFWHNINAGDIALDIAGNDGYLLSQMPHNMTTVSIDPAGGIIKEEAEKRCNVVIQDYFSKEVYRKRMGTRNAKIISCISMFYDLDDPDTFLKDVFQIMDDEGLFVIQLSYTPAMISQNEFSNICHEHLRYYSLFSIMPILIRNGFIIADVTLNETNVGSMRIFALKEGCNRGIFGTSVTSFKIGQFRWQSLVLYEDAMKMDEVGTWLLFYDRINELKERTVSFIKEEKAKGKTIMGYAASTKFNTVLQYFGLNDDLITAIAERSPEKYGLVTVGTNIPIISEFEMRRQKPDYLLIGAGHFLSEFKERESVLLKTGTRFIVTMPSFQIIGA